MSVKETARKQYTATLDRAAAQLDGLETPLEGWIASLRKALGMSGAQLARRMGVTRAAVHQAERNETDGAITLKQLEKVASALGGRLVYAVVPDATVEDAIRAHASRKAEKLIKRASGHMALENQSLSAEHTQQEIERLTDELARTMPPGFWEDG